LVSRNRIFPEIWNRKISVFINGKIKGKIYYLSREKSNFWGLKKKRGGLEKKSSFLRLSFFHYNTSKTARISIFQLSIHPPIFIPPFSAFKHNSKVNIRVTFLLYSKWTLGWILSERDLFTFTSFLKDYWYSEQKFSFIMNN
jgi:hypothetical protein